MSAVALSFRPASESAIVLRELTVRAGGAAHSNPTFLPDWDYATSVEISCDAVVDLDALRASTGLHESAGYLLQVVWHSSGSGLRGAGDSRAVQSGSNQVGLRLEGGQLGGTLTLELCLTLGQAPTQVAPLTAQRIGNVLWSEKRSIHLEGDKSRFPVSHVSFSSSGFAMGTAAAWMVHFSSTSPEDSALGNVVLYFNTDHPQAAEFTSSPETNPLLVQMVRRDVTRGILLQALGCDELDLDFEYEAGSLGELFVRTVRQVFPEDSIEAARGLNASFPAEFEAVVQGRTGFLR